MQYMVFSFEVIKHIYGLVIILVLSIFLLTASYVNIVNISWITRYFKTIRSYQIYMASVIGFVIITIALWVTDVYFSELPDPVIAYILFVLILSVAFGFRIAFYSGIISFLLVDYYLFEPRYRLYTSQEAAAIIISILGFLITLGIGGVIRSYQQGLIKKNTNLRQMLKARDRFAAVTAHDLKNPIATIKLYTQMLSKQTARKRADKLLSQSAITINKEADKLLSMIDLLLDFSKLESGKLSFKKQKCNLNDLCKEKITTMQSLNRTYSYKFKSDVKTAVIQADKVALDRVLINLLTNATKYSSPSTPISVELQKHNELYIISVKDHGKGILLKDQKKIFEPFYQTSESNKGLGLGLYIVKSIIEFHKGKIWLESQPGKGSTFYISLPVA